MKITYAYLNVKTLPDRALLSRNYRQTQLVASGFNVARFEHDAIHGPVIIIITIYISIMHYAYGVPRQYRTHVYSYCNFGTYVIIIFIRTVMQVMRGPSSGLLCYRREYRNAHTSSCVIPVWICMLLIARSAIVRETVWKDKWGGGIDRKRETNEKR